jgi:hypothetical protein
MHGDKLRQAAGEWRIGLRLSSFGAFGRLLGDSWNSSSSSSSRCIAALHVVRDPATHGDKLRQAAGKLIIGL